MREMLKKKKNSEENGQATLEYFTILAVACALTVAIAFGNLEIFQNMRKAARDFFDVATAEVTQEFERHSGGGSGSGFGGDGSSNTGGTDHGGGSQGQDGWMGSEGY